MKYSAKQLFFYSITLSLLLILVGASVIKDGMFMDGMLYACVAHNLSLGLGSFWYPYFSETTMSFFHEQPPLTFGIQSIFFTILGSSMYTERVYTFLLTLVNAFLILRIWKTLPIDKGEHKLPWLPVLLWIIIPICHWTFANNMEEVTMGAFVSLGILTLLNSFSSDGYKQYILAFIAGLLLIGAFLCKGFPGLYFLSLPGFYWLFTKRINFKQATIITVVMVASATLLFAVLISNTHIKESLFAYLFDRVFNSIENVSTGNDRFYIVRKLFVELLVPAGLTLIVSLLVYLKEKSIKIPGQNKQLAIALFVTGLAGTVPLMVTLEQRGFYFVTTLPLFAIALALMVSSDLSAILNKWNPRATVLKTVSLLLIVFSLSFVVFQKDKTRRHADRLYDIYKIGEVLEAGSTISVNLNIWDDWATLCYLVRYYNISCDANSLDHRFLLLFKTDAPSTTEYEKHEISYVLKKYDLYLKPLPIE